MAFTLIDVERQKAVRVRIDDDFFGNMLDSPFVKLRKEGVLPQDVPSAVADPLVERILALPPEKFLKVGPVKDYEFPKGKGCFNTVLCSKCGERVFADKVKDTENGPLCIPCSQE
jgi:formylmethanofuran dehydrogenase subunit E